MKKTRIALFIVIALCLVLTGCGKTEKKESKKEKKADPVPAVEPKPIVGGWNALPTEVQVGMDEQTINMFNTAIDTFTDAEVKAVALLGTQLVNGTNYMFLAEEYPENENFDPTYKIVIIHASTDGKAIVTSSADFDFENYTNIEIADASEPIVGGWTVAAPGKLGMISQEHIQEIFDEGSKKITDVTFNPIDVIATQVVSGTNYAILCYGKTASETPKEGIYLVTLYEDLDGNSEITTVAHIDLASLNEE